MSKNAIKLKNSLKIEDFVGSLIVKSIIQIKQVTNYETHKLNQDLTELVAKFVEKEIFESGIKDKTLNKREIVKEVFAKTFELTDQDILELDRQLKYLIENKIIKKRSLLYRIWLGVKAVVKLVL